LVSTNTPASQRERDGEGEKSLRLGTNFRVLCVCGQLPWPARNKKLQFAPQTAATLVDYCARGGGGGAMFIAVWCICATRKIRNTAPVVVNPHLLGCCSSIARFISGALQQPHRLCRRESSSSTGNYPDLAIYNFELRGAYIITPYVERRAHPQSASAPLKGLKCGHGVTMLYTLCSITQFLSPAHQRAGANNNSTRVGLVTGRPALNWIPQQAIFMLCELFRLVGSKMRDCCSVMALNAL
jgi:hypothetical protein